MPPSPLLLGHKPSNRPRRKLVPLLPLPDAHLHVAGLSPAADDCCQAYCQRRGVGGAEEGQGVRVRGGEEALVRERPHRVVQAAAASLLKQEGGGGGAAEVARVRAHAGAATGAAHELISGQRSTCLVDQPTHTHKHTHRQTNTS